MHNKIGCRVETEITFRGWRMVILENKNLRVSVLPEKGSNIVEFRYKPLDLDIMWESPLGLQSKEWFLATNGGGAQGNFMDYYEGGWQEIPGNPEVEILAGDGASRTDLLPGKGKWPTVSGKKGPVDPREVPSFKDKVSNMFFLTNLKEGRYRIKNPEKKVSFMMEWDAKVFSHLWYWQVAGGSFNYPWWGMNLQYRLGTVLRTARHRPGG